MNLFQMKTQPHGNESLKSFLTNNYVCIGYPNIGDLTNVDKDELRNILATKYNWTGSKLGNHLGIVNAFVNTMQKGDIVLITENDWVHIGELDEYLYDFSYESEGKCHRRNVKWLKTVKKDDLNEKVRELIKNRSIVTKFKHPYELAEIEAVLNGVSNTNLNKILVNKDLVDKAVNILTEALSSKDESIRVTAASEILRYYK